MGAGNNAIYTTNIEEKLLPKNNVPSVSKETDMKAVFNVVDPYVALEIRGISSWINSNPYLNPWYAKYKKDGKVRMTHFGEGSYAKTLTQETYLNYGRGERFANATKVQPDVSTSYHLINNLKPDEWSLGGSWRMGQESTLSTGNKSKLRIRFSGRELFLVMSGPTGTRIGAEVDGKPLSLGNLGGADVRRDGTVSLNGARLYKLVKSNDFIRVKELTFVFPTGVLINAFTFGS